MAGQADLAGHGGGVAFRASGHLPGQILQGRGVQLGAMQSFVAGKAAAQNAYRLDHVGGHAPGQVEQGTGQIHEPGGAGRMHGHGSINRDDVQPGQQKFQSEPGGFVQGKSLDFLLHPGQTWAGLAEDGQAAVVRGQAQGPLQFTQFLLGLGIEPFGLKGLAAA